MDPRIPVTLLTGFLGSGKTTLLNRLLRHPGMRDAAVVVNEIGEAGLDHILVRNVEDTYIADNTVLLGSGCLCCVLRTELADTLRDLFFRRALMAVPAFNRLVIETTGLADPGPILANLMNADIIREHYRLDAVVTTIDSLHGIRQLDDHAEARKQAAMADVLLLTKSDLADANHADRLAARLTSLNPGAGQYRIVHGEVDPAVVIDCGLFDHSGHKAQPQRWLRTPAKRDSVLRGRHDEEISSFTVTLPNPPTWSRLEPVLEAMCRSHGERLLRLKGIVHADDLPAPLAVHAVQHRLYPPTPLPGLNEEEPTSRIVLIGKHLDETRIREALTQD
jgi:G3E family GTPase